MTTQNAKDVAGQAQFVLEVCDLTVAYGGETVIDGLSWRLGGEGSLVTAILGPSGCGKSTLIRTIAGLESPVGGTVRFGGGDLAGVEVHRRDFGVVFQDGQLFGGRSVASNVAYGLKVRRWSRRAIADRVAEMLDVVALTGYDKRLVETLSGGQAQRVALARAMAPRPRLLLLDEPLAALDRRLRDELAVEISEIVISPSRSSWSSIFKTSSSNSSWIQVRHVSIRIGKSLYSLTASIRFFAFSRFTHSGVRRPARVLGSRSARPAFSLNLDPKYPPRSSTSLISSSTSSISIERNNSSTEVFRQ